MLEDNELGRERFELLRDDVLRRQVSVTDEKPVISRKKHEAEGEERGDCVPHVEHVVSWTWCISTELPSAERLE